MWKMQSNMKTKISLAVLLLTITAASVLLFSGCTETLKGDKTPNQAPIVYFVNIPPEGQTFSRNPVVYWVGTDRDGQIDYFRYHVTTLAEVGEMTPEEYIATVAGDRWIYLDVDPTEADPRTTNTIEMSADLSDPVNTYVPQYVFLQAFDEEGKESTIVYRLFSRNDNPPQTVVYGVTLDSPFVNSITPGGVITGVKLRWGGTDPIDYPSDPPPFEFKWKLFGPYTAAQFTALADSFFTEVYVTRDARVFRMGDTILRCDTFFSADSTDIQCDTIVVNASTPTTAFGGLEPFFRSEDEDFINSGYEGFNRVAQSSGNELNPWVPDSLDTIYDVFTKYYLSPGGAGIDTTVEMYFVFEVKSRDDAQVADLAPSFKTFTVIDPRRERDVAVIDFTLPTARNSTAPTSISVSRQFWTKTMERWKPGIDFDTTVITEESGPFRQQARDYFRPQYIVSDGGLRLVELLKHKVLIVFHDHIQYPNFFENADPIYTAIDAGINVWVLERGMLNRVWNQCQQFFIQIPATYQLYFGVAGTVYSGWLGTMVLNYCAYFPNNSADWVGAYSIDSTKWPNLDVDTALLHANYIWKDILGRPVWRPGVPALPEVNWCSRRFGTEIMYLYKSFYGNSHPLGFDLTFEGSPVGHRLNTGLFRTVHFCFTPLGVDTTQMQQLADSVLDWLYPENGESAAEAMSVNRYKDAPVRMTLEEARANFIEHRKEYLERLREAANEPVLR